MRRIAQVLLALVALVFAAGPLALLTGCAGELAAATLAANAAREAGLIAAAELEASCTSRYATATAAEVPALDARCLPLAEAYAEARAAHLALVSALELADRGEALDEASLAGLVEDLARAGQALSRARAGAR